MELSSWMLPLGLKKKVNISSMEVLLAEKQRIEEEMEEFMQKITKKLESIQLVNDDNLENKQAKKNKLNHMIGTE